MEEQIEMNTGSEDALISELTGEESKGETAPYQTDEELLAGAFGLDDDGDGDSPAASAPDTEAETEEAAPEGEPEFIQLSISEYNEMLGKLNAQAEAELSMGEKTAPEVAAPVAPPQEQAAPQFAVPSVPEFEISQEEFDSMGYDRGKFQSIINRGIQTGYNAAIQNSMQSVIPQVHNMVHQAIVNHEITREFFAIPGNEHLQDNLPLMMKAIRKVRAENPALAPKEVMAAAGKELSYVMNIKKNIEQSSKKKVETRPAGRFPAPNTVARQQQRSAPAKADRSATEEALDAVMEYNNR